MKKFTVLSIILVLSVFLFGCIEMPSIIKQTNESQNIVKDNISNVSIDTNQNLDTNQNSSEPIANNSFTNPSNQTAPTNSGDDLLILGRSVSQGWADYMGLEWDDDGTMSGTYQRYKIRRYEIESPPQIADSAIVGIERFDSNVIFFKLCFVDFSSEPNEGLIENEQYVQKVYDEAVTKQGKKLIVGNALPQTATSSGPGLRYNHEQYNAWLNNFALTHKDIYVLDLYGMLTDSSGNLRADYAVSSDDSHLNDAAYARITPELIRLIEKAESG